MSETDVKNLEALEAEAVAEAAADAPKKNAVAAEPSHIASMNNAEDLGPAVVKPTDSNPDATKKSTKVSDQISATADKGGSPDTAGKPDTQAGVTKVAHPGQSAKTEETDSDENIVNEGEMPDGLKKYLAKKDDKKDDKEEGYGSMNASKHKKMNASYKKEEIDVTEHVDALIAGEDDLSEEFKTKAATVFEAAIKSKVTEIEEYLEADYNNKFEEEISKSKEELVEKVDSYLNYVVEEWMKDNELALEKGIKGEIAEDFISGLKKLFEDHYIDVPDEKYNVLEDQAGKIEDLEKKLNEQIEKNVELNKSNFNYVQKAIVAEAAEDLADTSKEKFFKLAEEIDASNTEEFKTKIATIKESYFGKKTTVSEELDDVAAGENSVLTEDLSNAMAAYTAAISKTKDMKIVNNK
ncbi:hypothetical protein OAH34_00390 [bacterium]|jgi:hypothetical protein|nr:hypothetical protein [bacterium]